MFRKINGIKREYGYPILSGGEITAGTDEEKAETLAKPLIKFIVRIIFVKREG